MDCINDFFKTETQDASNKYECHNCEKLTIAQMRYRMIQLPRILILNVKRFGADGSKLKNTLNFEEEIQIDSDYLSLDKEKYSESAQNKEFNHIYRLYALIVHEGYSTGSGHYYAYIKNNEKWYCYNDDTSNT